MVELNTTWDTVVMLLVAGGVGLLGGVAGGLIEIRRQVESASREAGSKKSGSKKSGRKCGWGMFFSNVVLGGVAAVAILYFFPPQETVSVTVGDTTTTTTAYDLTKLVALALIVGSAGTSFLLILQKRTQDLLQAEKEKAANTSLSITTSQDIHDDVKEQVPSLAEEGVKKAAPGLLEAMPGITSQQAEEVTRKIADEVKDSVTTSVDSVAQEAKDKVLATVDPPLEPTKAEEKKGD